jgi:nucleoside-diphosphate-sugar epimerase
MDVKNKRILVLGGFGLVGQAVIKRLMREKPAHIVITSLHQAEAESAVDYFDKLYADEETTFEPYWGNLFVREDWKDLPRESILADAEKRDRLIEDILGELSDDIATSNTLFARSTATVVASISVSSWLC